MAPKTFRTLPAATQIYIAAIVVAGAFTVGQSALVLAEGQLHWNWLVLAALTLLSGSATVSLPSLPATVSVSETFVFTSVILFGPSAGTLTVALDAAVISFWSYRRGQPAYKIVFNICALPLTIWIASNVFFWTLSLSVPNAGPLFRNSLDISLVKLFWPLVVFAIVYFSLNSWIITFAISLERGLPPFAIWRDHFALLSLNYFGGASVAALLVSYTKDLDYTYLAVIVPLLVVLYFTFSTSMGRVEDANRHLTELNSLYMSTIETLAMAIDAKDQITHGHIRRVQTYAVGLAKRLGVCDTSLIRAVEAAALLHDMGKLAVPEYILNKPGPLTPAEFEKMKLHASVGADILSSIKFPYPVVPIVRHHHENWDGSGYPDGLVGTDIPMGARILAVVDCFDALTSDRPYRPKLPDAEAIKILKDRRGRMYDPLVVDTFLTVHQELTPKGIDETAAADGALSIITKEAGVPASLSGDHVFNDIASSTEETVVLYELARRLNGSLSFSDASDALFAQIRRIIPASTCAVYVFNSDVDELCCRHASGENASHFIGLRIPRGQRLTGWIAANKQSIVNSDPVLDLGEAARALKPRLQSCLGTPLLIGEQLFGVLALYSTSRNAFSDKHSRVVEIVAKQVAPSLASCLETEHGSRPSSKRTNTEIPTKSGQSASVIHSRAEAAEQFSIIYIRIANLRTGVGALRDHALESLVTAVRKGLRGADMLFRYDGERFVVLLAQTDRETTKAVRDRVVERLVERAITEPESDMFSIRLAVASAPVDGVALGALIETAESRLQVVIPYPQQPPSVH